MNVGRAKMADYLIKM